MTSPTNQLETIKIIKEILRLYSLGHSISQSCKKLAHGDKQLSIRYQNLYRNTLCNKKSLVQKCYNELKDSGYILRALPQFAQKSEPNIVYMDEYKAKLSYQDIEALFWGLIKLIKKQAENEVDLILKKDAEIASAHCVKLTQKLEELKIKINATEQENNLLKEKLCSQKQSKLKKFLAPYNLKEDADINIGK